MEENKGKPDQKITYITDTHTDNTAAISIAIMKTDIDYIKKAVDSMGRDIHEIKGMFLPLAQAATKEEMSTAESRINSIEEKVGTIYKLGGIISIILITALIGAWLKLIIIP